MIKPRDFRWNFPSKQVPMSAVLVVAPRSWLSIWPLIPIRGLVPVAIYALTVHSLAAGEAETTLVGIPLKRHPTGHAVAKIFSEYHGKYGNKKTWDYTLQQSNVACWKITH